MTAKKTSKNSEILERGDIIWIDFSPSLGKEIIKRRPALVISPKIYNEKSNLIICCPITSSIRNGPWEVKLPKNPKVNGAILANQVSSFDKHARNAKKISKAPKNVIEEVILRLSVLVNYS